MELTERQKLAAAKLDTYQLKFANSWLERHVTGKTAAQCYFEAYPNCENNDTARTMASRALRLPQVAEYIESVREHLEILPTIATLTELQEQLSAVARADMTDIVEWLVDDNGQPVPKIKNLSELPKELRRLVKSVTWTKNGPKIELEDQAKARDMLIRTLGGYKDRVELSGGLAVAAVDIDTTDPGKAAELYKNLIKGQA